MILNVPVEIYALIIAVLIDLFFGDPPNKWHPTAWIGLSIRRLKFLSPSSNYVQFIYGVFLFLIIIIFWAGTTYLLNYYIQSLNYILYVLIIGLFLKSTFSIRMLHKEASKIKTLLEQDDLDQVRLEMPALVSRDTSNLTSQQSLAATIESVSENVTDSFTGPMIAFAFFGLPGAVAYRVVNTLDSMIGYRGEYEYLGKFSAKIDDLLNFIPARLSAGEVVMSNDAADLWGRDNLLKMNMIGNKKQTYSKLGRPNKSLPITVLPSINSGSTDTGTVPDSPSDADSVPLVLSENRDNYYVGYMRSQLGIFE